ncbi:MAG: hypothetical protein WBQ50_19775, partial [Nocardioides sp.]
MPHGRPARAGLATGLVGVLSAAGYLGVWEVVVERQVCESTGMFACAGPALVMYVVGIPLAYVVWSLGLRAVRAPLPWLLPVVTVLVLAMLAPLVDPPVWVWPAVTGLVGVF